MLRFYKTYFFLSLALFLIELFIGFFVHDRIIRPFGGDFLVVILLYCLLKTFVRISARNAALAVLAFAFAVEFAQYFNVVEILGLQHNRVARILIGTVFSWGDLLVYSLGVLAAYHLDLRYMVQTDFKDT